MFSWPQNPLGSKQEYNVSKTHISSSIAKPMQAEEVTKVSHSAISGDRTLCSVMAITKESKNVDTEVTFY